MKQAVAGRTVTPQTFDGQTSGFQASSLIDFGPADELARARRVLVVPSGVITDRNTYLLSGAPNGSRRFASTPRN